MDKPPGMRRLTYTLVIWNEPRPDRRSVWRGWLQTLAGQRFAFDSLAELNRLLAELGGWMDQPDELRKP